MNPRTVFLTGGNRGLGLQFVKDILKLQNPPKHLIVTCREPENASVLQEIASSHQAVRILKLDLLNDLDEPKVQQLVGDVERIVGDEGLNLIIHNAGMNSRNDPLSNQLLMNHFSTNVFGPILLTKAMSPLLQKAASLSKVPGQSFSKAGVLNVSSVLGSIAKNTSPGLIAYKSTKAALNMVTSTFAYDLGRRGVIVMSMHPGWVKTDMGGKHAPVTIEESVAGMMNLMATCGDEHNGKFYAFDGEELPW